MLYWIQFPFFHLLSLFPLFLQELVKTFDMTKKTTAPNGIVGSKTLKSNPSTNSLYGLDVVSHEHKQLVEDISKHIIYGMFTVSYVFCQYSTSIFVLLVSRFFTYSVGHGNLPHFKMLVEKTYETVKRNLFARKVISFSFFFILF